MTVRVGGRTADYERRDAAGETTVVVRCHAGDEGTYVLSSDIWVAVRRWARRADHNCLFVFCSNCELYPTAVTIVGERLDRIQMGSGNEEDAHLVRLLGLEPESALLRNLRVHVRADNCGKLASHLLGRVRHLTASSSAGSARSLMEISASCDRGPGTPPRLISFAEVSAALGVEPDRPAPPVARPIHSPANYRDRVLGAVPAVPACVVRGCLFDPN